MFLSRKNIYITCLILCVSIKSLYSTEPQRRELDFSSYESPRLVLSNYTLNPISLIVHSKRIERFEPNSAKDISASPGFLFKFDPPVAVLRGGRNTKSKEAIFSIPQYQKVSLDPGVSIEVLVSGASYVSKLVAMDEGVLPELVSGRCNPYFDATFVNFFSNQNIERKASRDILNSIKHIVVLNWPSTRGGPQSLCQFFYETKQMGFDSYMVWLGNSPYLAKELINGKAYLSYNPPQDLTPDYYRQTYGVRILDKKIPLDETTLVILTEAITNCESFFAPARRLIYWLSLDYFSCKQTSIFQGLIQSGSLFAPDCLHATNTRLVEKKLTSWGVQSLWAETYMSLRYFQMPNPQKSEKCITYNPRKGGQELAQEFIRHHPEYKWVPIENLDEEGVFQALCRSSIYIDFGNFPGRERVPREALLCGNIIFIHYVGCAKDYDTYPLDPYFTFLKTDLDSDGLGQKLQATTTNRLIFQGMQNPFRLSLLDGRRKFQQQIQSFLGNPVSTT